VYELSHSGLNSKERSILERSIKKINIKTIPVYQCFNEFSFTQVIPPPKRKKNRPPPFATLLNSPSNLKINGVGFNFKKQLERLIVREFREGFKYAPLLLSKYESKDIPLIHLKTRSEKDDQEEKESDCKIKNESNTEFDFKTIIEPSSIIPLDSNTIRHETNPSTSNININI